MFLTSVLLSLNEVSMREQRRSSFDVEIVVFVPVLDQPTFDARILSSLIASNLVFRLQLHVQTDDIRFGATEGSDVVKDSNVLVMCSAIVTRSYSVTFSI